MRKKKEPAKIFYCKNCQKPFKACVSSRRVFCNRNCQKDEFSPSYKGGKYKDIYGYIVVYKPNHPMARKDGYILEHRLVMSNYLRRYLQRKEYVHHINGIRTDNKIGNLEIVTLGKHNTIHKTGKPHTEETKKRISETQKWRWAHL